MRPLLLFDRAKQNDHHLHTIPPNQVPPSPPPTTTTTTTCSQLSGISPIFQNFLLYFTNRTVSPRRNRAPGSRSRSPRRRSLTRSRSRDRRSRSDSRDRR